MTTDYCPTCWKLYDQLSAANNQMEYAAQCVRDIGSSHYLTLYCEADTVAKLARINWELHRAECEKAEVAA